MQNKTLIAIATYGPPKVRVEEDWTVSNAGQTDLLKIMLPYSLHHNRKVLVLSPFDAPMLDLGIEGVDYRYAGKRAYIGQLSLDRQIEYLKILQEHDSDWYLFNDTDSCCLSPEIPKYLYEDKYAFYSKEVIDPRTHPTTLPRLAFHPPYFFSKQVLARLIEATDKVVMNDVTPFVDHYMLQLCCAAGITHKPFKIEDNGIGELFIHPVKKLEQVQEYKNRLTI